MSEWRSSVCDALDCDLVVVIVVLFVFGGALIVFETGGNVGWRGGWMPGRSLRQDGKKKWVIERLQSAAKTQSRKRRAETQR